MSLAAAHPMDMDVGEVRYLFLMGLLTDYEYNIYDRREKSWQDPYAKALAGQRSVGQKRDGTTKSAGSSMPGNMTGKGTGPSLSTPYHRVIGLTACNASGHSMPQVQAIKEHFSA